MVSKGMYHRDVRDGEGVLTYPGGVKDEGTWKGTKLMQLKFAIVDVHFDLCCSIPLESLGVSPKRKRRGPIGHLEVGGWQLLAVKLAEPQRKGGLQADIFIYSYHRR